MFQVDGVRMSTGFLQYAAREYVPVIPRLSSLPYLHKITHWGLYAQGNDAFRGTDLYRQSISLTTRVFKCVVSYSPFVTR